MVAIVCIDFAFAHQRDCMCHAPSSDDWDTLADTLFDVGAAFQEERDLVECWIPRDIYEW